MPTKTKIVDGRCKFKYSTGKLPKTYKCGTCDVHGVKLWREYNIFLNYQVLRCAACAAKNQKVELGTLTTDGKHIHHSLKMLTDQIGMLIPAVPTEENDTFWGYSSVPESGCIWWKNLPNSL